MSKILALLVAAGLLAVTAPAAEQTVSYKSGEEQVSGFLALPEGKGPFPAVVAIQEWWGLNDWVKDQARAMANQGYVALAVDLYRGKVAAQQEEAHQLMMGAPPDRTLRDLKAALAFFRSRPDVKKERVGSIGWCMGGRLSLPLAVEDPGLAAAVACYGAPPTAPAAVPTITPRVLRHTAPDDKLPAPPP